MCGSSGIRNESYKQSLKPPAESRIDSDIFNYIFDDIPLIMILVNRGGKVENINHATTIALGKEKEESFGLLGGELFGCANSFKVEGCGKNRECTKCTVRNSVMQTFETGEKIYKKEGELEILTNGRSVTLHLLISTILIKQNTEPMVLLTFDDITEQKLAEKEALEASAKNEAIINILPDLIFECKRDGTIVDYRPSANISTYVQPNEFLGKKVSEVLPKEVADRIIYSIEQLMQTKKLQHFDYQLLIDGKITDFEARLVLSGNDSILAIISDITERKLAEKELRISEEKYSTLVENGNDGIVITQDGLLKFANSKMLEITGLSLEELIGKPFSDHVCEEHRDLVLTRHTDRLNNGKNIPSRYEFNLLCKDGNRISLDVSASTIEYENRPAVMSILRDITKNKDMLNSLKKSEKKFRDIFNNSNDLICIHDIEGKLLEVNKVVCEVTCYGRHELLQISIMDLVPPEYKSKLIDDVKRLQENKNSIFETLVLCKGGSHIPIEVSNRLIEYEGKTAVLSIGRDITERKKTEHKIKESEAKYKEVVSSMDAIFWKADVVENGNFINTYISPFADKLLWVEEGTIDWNAFLSYVHPEDITQLRRKRVEAIHKQSPLDYYEYRVIRADGTQLWLYEKAISTVNSEGTLQLFGTTVDITELKSIQSAMMVEKDRAQRYFDSAKIMMLVLDVNNNIVQINKKGCEIFGYEEEDIVGKNCIENFLPEDVREQVENQFEYLISSNNKKIEYYENPILNSAGEERWIAWNNTILTSKNGDFEGVLSSGQDITERRVFEKNLLNAQIASELANRSKSEFLANMSHELRTPLNSVIGFSDVLCTESHGELNEKQKKFISSIHKNGQNLLKIINNILNLSAIEARAIELNCEKFLLYDVFREVQENAIPFAMEKNISIDLDIEYLIFIDADRDKIKQILNNLISNAIKFNEHDGSIVIKARSGKNEMNISVKDTGIGIPEKEIGKLFDPFYQIDGSSTRNYGGNGIGLALVKHFAEMHRGSVWIESQDGLGTEVHIRLPAENRFIS